MSTVNAKFISGLDDYIAKLYTPSILSDQVFTVWVDEPFENLPIRGDNFFLGGIPVHHELYYISQDDILNKCIYLKHSIPAGYEHFTSLALNGCPLAYGNDFSASGNSISWDNKALGDFQLLEGDALFIVYPSADILSFS